MVDLATGENVDEFQSFVRPGVHPLLTPFCQELTHIRQADVDAAPHFRDAMAKFHRWIFTYDRPVFMSWGDYDRNQFSRDCIRHGMDYRLPEHINLKSLYSQTFNCKKLGLMSAIESSGLVFEGSYHRGIDDARNAANLLRCVLATYFPSS